MLRERATIWYQKNLVKKFILAMSEEHPGASFVIEELRKVGQTKKMGEESYISKILLYCDDMNIRGEQLWVGYDVCSERNIERFVTAVSTRDPYFVETINRVERGVSYPHKAVVSVLANGGRREFLE